MNRAFESGTLLVAVSGLKFEDLCISLEVCDCVCECVYGGLWGAQGHSKNPALSSVLVLPTHNKILG